MGGFRPSRTDIAGSTIAGSDKDVDVHQFTGSVDITGSLTLNGSSITSGGGGDGAVSSYTNAGDNRVITSVNSNTINAESDLTFDGTSLTATQVTGSETAYFTKVGIASDGASPGHTTQPLFVKGEARFQGTTNASHIPHPGNEYIYLRGGLSTSHVILSDTSATQKVGIGIQSPTAKLHVSSSDGTAPLFRIDHQSPGDNLDTRPIFYVTGSGLIGIGTASPRQAADPYSTGDESTRVHILGEHGTDQGEDPVQNTLLMLENNNHAGIQFMTPDQRAGQIAWGKPGNNRIANMYFSSADNRYHFEGPGFGNKRIMTMIATGDSINMGSSQGVGMTQTSASLFISSSTEGDTLGTALNHAVLFQLAHENSPQLLFVTGSGRMGLGTWAPSASLHVSSSDIAGVPIFQVDGKVSANPHISAPSIDLSEHVTNGSFADASDWTLGGTGFAIGSNKATYTHPGGDPTSATLTQAVADLAKEIVPGRMYELSYVVSDNTGFSGQITLVRNDGVSTGIPEQAYSDSQLLLETANGSYTMRFRADFSPGTFQIQIDGVAGTVALSGLSIKECLPNVGLGTDKPAAMLHVSASSAGRENLFMVSPSNAKSGDNTPAFSIVQDEDGDWYTTFGQGPQRAYAMSINLNNGGGQSTMQIANGSVNAFVSSFTFGNSGASCNVILANPTVPGNASAAGTTGEIAWDSGHFYVCVATNTWKRVAISTF